MFGNDKRGKLFRKEKGVKKKDVYDMLLSIGPAKKAVIYFLSILLVIIYMLPFYWMFLKMFRSSIFAHFPPDLNPFSLTSLGNFIVNFRDVISFGSFPLWYFNSVFVAVLVVSGSVAVGSAAGYAFARLHFKGRDLLFYAVLATLMIPFPVISIASYIFMLDLGWISTYQGLILPEIVSGLNVFIFRQYFMTIPADVENAAKLDGLNPFQIFYRISAPMARPAFAAATIYTFIGTWNNFLWPLMEVHSQNLFTLPLVLNFFKGVNGTQIYWNEMMTVVFLTLIPTLVIYIIFERYFVEGFTLSGVKG
ncbi:MAG: carbohydrate ABC transporter permease [Cuniculiplasma sp.]